MPVADQPENHNQRSDDQGAGRRELENVVPAGPLRLPVGLRLWGDCEPGVIVALVWPRAR